MRSRVAIVPWACGLLLACGGRPRAAPAPDASHARWSFEVAPSADASELRVTASFPAGTPPELGVEEGAARFVSDVEQQDGGSWRAVDGSAIRCVGDGCTFRYRFHLRDAAVALHDADVAEAFGDAFAAPASTFLLHPGGTTPAAWRVRVAGAAPFLSGVPPVGDGAYEARANDLDDSPYFGIGAWRPRDLRVGRAEVPIGIAPAQRAMTDDALVAWIARAAETLRAYLGELPTPRVLALIAPASGGEIHGRTLGEGGVSVLFRVGVDVPQEKADDDWVATHELVHANMPTFGHPHEWFEEGMATYVEPIARARTGRLSPDRVWHDLLAQGPDGLPKPGDRGLEETHTWERTYWGGAIFFLQADVAIRERTGGTRSIDDALRAIARLGAGASDRAEIVRALDAGDAATGTRALHELYDRLALAPGAVDLQGLFARLGVSLRDGDVVYDDAAPLAALRKAITAPS